MPFYSIFIEIFVCLVSVKNRNDNNSDEQDSVLLIQVIVFIHMVKSIRLRLADHARGNARREVRMGVILWQY